MPALLLAAVLAAACDQAQNRAAQYRLAVGPSAAVVEVAADPAARARGLSGRRSLAEGCGMLFIFPSAGQPAFWMKDTHVPLSIAFITADGKIAQMEDMRPESLDRHAPAVPVVMALEMQAGWFDRNGVRQGDRVVLPAELAGLLAR